VRLITSQQAIEFLSQAAPKPWVKRMLLWMILDEGVYAYFRKGTITPHTIALEFTAGLVRKDGANRSLDELIAEQFHPEMAAKLLGKEIGDRVDDQPTEWSETDEPHIVSAGFFLWAEDRNWEAGTIAGDASVSSKKTEEWLFWDEDEHLLSEFDSPSYEFKMSGLCFDHSVVEMLLPNLSLPEDQSPIRAVVERRGAIGRPPKWDWESALEHMIAKAQTPDGLPSGPGAQAEIERMIADWFVQTENASPSESQIRSRAQRIMRSVENRKATF
jgi:hypothetical protein